jgi:hypothetical protein
MAAALEFRKSQWTSQRDDTPGERKGGAIRFGNRHAHALTGQLH